MVFGPAALAMRPAELSRRADDNLPGRPKDLDGAGAGDLDSLAFGCGRHRRRGHFGGGSIGSFLATWLVTALRAVFKPSAFISLYRSGLRFLCFIPL